MTTLISSINSVTFHRLTDEGKKTFILACSKEVAVNEAKYKLEYYKKL